MKIKFLGGVHEVTGSTHILMTDKSAVMRDCGMFQGHRAEAREKNIHVLDNVKKLDAVVLSHAHIDHSGNIPALNRINYTGPIHTTHATADLCEYMLRDSAHIQELDAKYLNKKLARKNEPLIEPIYSIEDVENILPLFKGHDYHKKIQITDDIAITAYDAGHVLGAALHIFDVNDNGTHKKIGYAFDLGRKNLPILNDVEQINDIDALVIESTYGNRLHDDIRDAADQLAEAINRTYKRGGKIIIPSFALERSQEILYTLEKLVGEQRIPKLPVYLDSPLAVKVTDVFRRHSEIFDRETSELLKSGGEFLGDSAVTCTQSVDESIALNEDKRSMIIISASGMCEAGRILHHLKNNIEDERNTVLIVGYQAQHTLGRRIVEKNEEVKIFGKPYKLNAEVVVLNTFSGHADRNDLLNYVDNISTRCKTFVFVHGEEDALGDFANTVKYRRPDDVRIEIPNIGDEIEL